MNTSVLVHSIPEACAIACSGRTALYEAIRSGALRAVKRGRRTLVLEDDLRRWLQSLPPVAVRTDLQSETVAAAKRTIKAQDTAGA
jgi:excisionase family DNA binding protein